MGALTSSVPHSHGVSGHCNQSEGAGDGGKAQPEERGKLGKEMKKNIGVLDISTTMVLVITLHVKTY